jgi:hypothetical protein
VHVRRWAYFAGGAAIAVAYAVACLPDLVVAPMTPPPLTHPCGDGFTDLDAGEQCDPGTNVIDAGDAGAVGCTGACAIACEGKIGTNGHCYFLVADDTFDHATKSACGPGAHIVTISSEEELTNVVAKVPSLDAGAPFWVGLHNDGTNYVAVNDEPGWGAGCAGCFGIPADDAGFRTGTGTGNPLCVVATTDVFTPWAKAACGATHHVICEREPLGSLSDPCADFTGNGGCITLRSTKDTGKRYLFVSESTTASDADLECRMLNRGSLVVFASREEREELMRELAVMTAPTPPMNFWIGLTRGGDAGTEWTWDDNAPESAYPLPWAGGEPIASKDGGPARAYADRSHSNYDNQLAHVEATNMYPYVCQYY